MRAFYLVKNGEAQGAFELRESQLPALKPHEVLVEVATFGINFADVLARKGLYDSAPPKPCVLGYEVAGKVAAIGAEVTHVAAGDRVAALTRFGGYATLAIADGRAVAKLPDSVSFAEANALTTQYCTAYYNLFYAANVQPGEKVLVHSAAGGVGIALTQLAKLHGCEVFATVGSDSKKQVALDHGAHHVINYNTENFVERVAALSATKKVDVIFDAVGGKVFKQGKKAIATGGRMVLYGASTRTQDGKSPLALIKLLFDFGFLHPVWFIMKSVGLLGVNMLHIADHKPQMIQLCLQAVLKLAAEGKIKPLIHAVYTADELAVAHEALENRGTTGKLVVAW